MTELIQIREEKGILRVAFNNPQKKNAILPEMYVALNEAFSKAERSQHIRALLLEGNGDMFTAGNDMASFIAPHDRKAGNPTLELMKRAALAEKPLIAAVNGPAVGIGVTLILSFDLIFANENAFFLTPFVNLGGVPEAGSSALLPEIIGHQAAAEFLLTGDRISAQRAYEMGLINKLVKSGEDVAEVAMQSALNIASKPPEAVRLTKKLMRGDTDRLIGLIEKEMKMFAERTRSEEMKEAVTAFIEKRPPDFSRFS